MANSKTSSTKLTDLRISVKKCENVSRWYTEVLIKAEFLEYYKDVSGCYIMRPWSFELWEAIQTFIDSEIKQRGVQNCYFPMFVSAEALQTEATHIDDFAPEVAWVTRSGTTELQNPIAVRPTSETIICQALKNWIRSHRDLPLRLNQWVNVVRWEFKQPTPFLRAREFLWQEGHSSFETKEEADAEVLDILELYARTYEDLLAVPVIKGKKSKKEQFAGSDYSTTVEIFVPASGRAIQAGTSHHLGQNFSKMFKIGIPDEKDGNATKNVWQNSWGFSTRSIGAAILVHGDDKGAVLAPRAAPIQVVGVFIVKSSTPEETTGEIKSLCSRLIERLRAAGLRVKYDDRVHRKPGWKYNYWEQKGVPIRLEVGPKDLHENKCVLVRRDNGLKQSVDIDNIEDCVKEVLEDIQSSMFQKALEERKEQTSVVRTFEEFVQAFREGKLILAPWHESVSSEEWVKKTTAEYAAKMAAEDSTSNVQKLTSGAKTLCIPFEQPELNPRTKCFTNKNLTATCWAYWGRSY